MLQGGINYKHLSSNLRLGSPCFMVETCSHIFKSPFPYGTAGLTALTASSRQGKRRSARWTVAWMGGQHGDAHNNSHPIVNGL